MEKTVELGRFILLLCMTLVIFPMQAMDTIRYIEFDQNTEQYTDYERRRQGYFVDLLKLVLEASKDKYGNYQLIPVSVAAEQARTTLLLRQNKVINVMWRVTSEELEEQLQAIYFPLLKGLMGYRIFIIRKNDQYLFNKDISLAQLQRIPVGQGYNWPDTKILKANGFNVVSGFEPNLLKMLKYKRFDYFPRALHEPWLEINDSHDFIIEKHLMLKYISPIYFFVNKADKPLYERLNYGFQALHHSGDFEKYFLNHPASKNIMKKATVNQRTVFYLTNPLLSEKTLQISKDKHFWVH